MEYNYNGTPIRLYRDVNKTEQHLLTLSPIDEQEIKALCDNIRKVHNEEVGDVTQYELSEQDINQFSHEGIRELLHEIQEEGVPVILTLGILANGDGGFLKGGSLPFVRRVIKSFKTLGGKIRYGMRADRVVVENGKVTGVISGDELFLADAVIVTCDTMIIDQLFDTPPQASWLDKMRAVTVPTMCIQISLGINADLKHYSERLTFKLKKPIYLAGQAYYYLILNNYAADPTYSP